MKTSVREMKRLGMWASLAVGAALALAPATAAAQEYYPPPPPPGAPGGYEAPPPGYAPPGGYVPPTVGYSGPRLITDWEEGEPIPAGYHTTHRFRKGLIVGGAVTFGVTYLFNVIGAAAAHDANGGGTPADALYAPVIGPFILMGSHSTDTALGKVGLAIDGLAQAAGATMLICGLALPKTVLVRNDLGKVEVTVTPMSMGKGGNGLGLAGTF